MASHFTPKHISSFGLLERIHPQILFRFLQRYHDFFTAEGVMPSTAAAIDHERLSRLLAFPNEKMPALLMADLFYWDEVASMASIDDLLEVAEKHGLAFSDEITIEEAALLVRMEAPEELEDLHAVYHAHGLLRKKKRFLSYFATVAKLPPWRNPSTEALRCFEQAMDAWYEPRKKGRGTRVSVIEKDDAVWFIVRHGGTFQRENAMEEGESKMVFYRPEAFDLLIYYPAKGELAIYNDSRSDMERRAYCTNLGTHLFDDAKFFESESVGQKHCATTTVSISCGL